MRLLYVEDDPRIAAPVSGALREAGYTVTHCADAAGGLREALSGDYALLLLDVMLPGTAGTGAGDTEGDPTELSGFEIGRRVRAAGLDAAILFLTARGELDDRVRGLDLGGDAYLVKPVAVPELLATLRALSRRHLGSGSAHLPFAAGRGLLDTAGRTVRWDGQEVTLTGREYALLETLLLGRGRWFTREALLERVWGQGFGGEARIVDVYVRYLRRKLGAEAVQSERGRGYRAEE